jgi:hypothetical protein
MAHDVPFPRYAADGESPRFRHQPAAVGDTELVADVSMDSQRIRFAWSRHPTAGKPGIETAARASGRYFPQSTSGGITLFRTGMP